MRAEYIAKARPYAIRHAKTHGTVTSDDVWEVFPIPEGIDGRAMGAVFNTPELERVGYTQTRRKTSHGRTIGLFAYRKGVAS